MAGSANLWRSTKNMVKKAKVYGKQKINNLTADLQKFNVASPAKGKSGGSHALSELSPNSSRPRQHTEEDESGKVASDKENVKSVKHNLTGRVLDVKEDGKPRSGKQQLVQEVTKTHDAVKPLTSLDSVLSEVEDTRACFSTKAEVFHIEKIAEGSYASILRITLKVDPSQFSICKLIPIKPNDAEGPKYDLRTYIDDAIAEVKILSLMRDIPGFVNLRQDGARVLQGIIPPVLQRAFNAWEEANPHETPISCEYSEEQYWALLEMVDAGTDLGELLENGFPDGTRLHEETPGARLTPYQTWDIFWGVAEALAAGEDLAKFEHRDLHLSNICIKRKGSGCADDTDETQMLSKTTRYTDLEVTLIDYTLSRATAGEHEVLANQMLDKTLFFQESEAADERVRENDQHQYDTYDRMRKLVLGDARLYADKKGRAKVWKKYVPETNLLWLHHLLFVLLRDTQKQRTARLDYTQDKLVRFLVKIRNELDPERINEWVYRSAKDVVNEEHAAEVERGERSLDKEFEGIRTRSSEVSDGGQGSGKAYSGIDDGGQGSSKAP